MRLIAENLGGERGGEPVFASVDFALGGGEAMVVTGPNGSGKSTLLRVLCALLPAAQGRAIFEGGGEEFPTVAAACHYLGHQNAMKAGLTATENLVFWRSFLGPGARGLEVAEALDEVGLGDIGHLPFGYLSTGQRRRAAIARLLVSHRPVWLLDEPTSGLDKASEARLTELMTAHRAAGGIIVAATHLPLGIEAGELRMGKPAYG
ncbi:heme ABC exporter ATP-binding protein CcmA [Mesorhizobium sp. PUT5]|uniref:heme ABC exporter ATP-binding protein CcmA n=1 Tax=Mesorhizobium sp. PUT5 TaxID=3454629 RepID=UPI003FA43083